MATGGRTALWWDTVTCPLPSPSDPCIVRAMSSALLRRFRIINVHAEGGGGNLYDHFSAYRFFSETQTEFDQTLINAGIRLQQTSPRDCDVEKMMMADVLLWAMDTPPPANIVFIVGYMDFSYVFEKLRQRSYNVFLVTSSSLLVPEGMLKAANDYMGWYSFLRSIVDEIRQHIRSAPEFRTVHDCTSSSAAISLMLEETDSRSIFYNGLESSFKVPYFSSIWNSTNNSSPNEAGRSSVQPAPRFIGHYITAEKSVRPPLLPSSTEDPERPTLRPPNTEKIFGLLTLK